MQFRTDLAIEAREIAGENTGGIEFKKYSENGLEISRLIVKTKRQDRHSARKSAHTLQLSCRHSPTILPKPTNGLKPSAMKSNGCCP